MKTKRNFLISILTMVMAVCAFMGVLGITNAANVKAEGQTFYVDNSFSIKMDEGAIRFYTVMDAETKALAEQNGYGFFIFPNSYYTEVSALNKADFHNTLPKKVEIEGNANGTSKIYSYENGLYATNAVIKNLKYESFGIEFTCVAFVENGDGTYTYAYNEDLSVSAYEELSATYLSGLEDVDYDKLMATYGDHADETRTNYSFGKNNPILITNESQIAVIASNVADGADTYEGLNFKLAENITLANTTASIGSDFLGTIDGNGKTVTGELDATLVVGKTATELNYVENVLPLTVENDIYLKVTEENSINKTGYSNGAYSVGDKLTFLTSEDYAEEGLTGDYTGNAIKWSAVNNSGWNFINQLSDFARSIDNLEKQYDTVIFNFAIKDTRDSATGSYYWNVSDGMLSYSNIMTSATSGSMPVTKYASGEWFEIKVPISHFISYTQGKESVFYFNHSWSSMGSGGSHMDFYFGDIEFSSSVPSKLMDFGDLENAVYFNENGEKKVNTFIYNGDIWKNKAVVSAEEVAQLGFSGNYSGPAIKYASSNNSNWYVVNRFTEKQLDELVNKYSYVRLNYAAVKNSAWVEGRAFSYYNSSLIERDGSTLKFTFDANNVNQWMAIDFTVESFVKYLRADGSVTADPTDASKDNVLRLHHRSWGSGKFDGYDIYMGNIEFVLDEPSDPIIVDENNYTSYSCAHNTVTATRTYLSAEEVAALGFTGDYTGAATRFNDTIGNQVYYLEKSYSTAELNYIKDNYTSVSVWVAKQVTLKEGASSWTVFSGQLYPNGNWPNYNSKWVKVTISVDRFIECVSGQSSIAITKLAVEKMSSIESMYAYFGNIEFVK